MMMKYRILAAVCSLVFVMNGSACGASGQEVLLIGRMEADQEGELPVLSGDSREEASGQLWTGEENGREETPPGQPWTGKDADTSGSVLLPGETGDICVYVCGAVRDSGVVFLPEGSRAADALEAAGGFAPEAAEEAVNLAARVSDGEKLYFPTREEYASRPEEYGARTEGTEAAGLVNINTADAAQLCTLPGIGESRAADIIAYRDSHGGFSACEDIMKVSGIKESVYQRISGKISVR